MEAKERRLGLKYMMGNSQRLKQGKAKRKRKYVSEVHHGGRAGHIQKSPVYTLILFTLNYIMGKL